MFISYFVSFVLHFVMITGKSCKKFRSVRNIAVDPSMCRMEMFSTPDWTFDCVERCDENQQVRHSLTFCAPEGDLTPYGSIQPRQKSYAF